jgi:DNA-binding MarR family transcriptional regulator
MLARVKKSLAEELRPVVLRLARQLRRESHAFGVSGIQLSLLAEIEREPETTARRLAAHEQISEPAMSRHVAGLEAAGFIRRERGSDRRRAPLHLTDEGKQVLRAVRRQRTAWLAERLELLSAEEQRAIEAAIGPLTSLLEQDRA